MPLKDPGTHKTKLLHDNFHYTFDFMMQGKGVMNTHDLGLDLKWTRGCVCADAGFVILNSYSSFQSNVSAFSSFDGVH